MFWIRFLLDFGYRHTLAGDNVDDTVTDDEDVNPGFLLPQDADAGPQVDHQGDQGEGNVGEKVTCCPLLIHLEGGFKKQSDSIMDRGMSVMKIS